jgi:hypothetical protein
MHRHELIERFSLERVGSSPATFDYQKLDWLNGVHLRELPPDEYARHLLTWLREQGLAWPDDRVRATVPLVQEKIERFGQYPDFVGADLPSTLSVLYDNGLNFLIIGVRTADTPAGLVMSQSPGPGAKADDNTAITLVVSRAPGAQ